MPRFEEQDPNSPLYLGPTGISDIGDDPLSPSDLMPTPPVPMSMQGAQVNPYIPTPNANPNMPTFDTNSIMNTINTATNNLGRVEDPFYMGKATMGDFRNPHLQNQFYDRYKGHSQFDNLGFSPFRDNETLYNENSSTWDEFKRATKPMANLAVTAFKDAMTWGSVTDVKTAKEFEKQMAIGSSSKGGFGGFATNLYLNSGYTLGIIAETLFEDAVIAGLEVALTPVSAATFGATLPAQAALGAYAFAKTARGIKKISSGWKMARNLRKTLLNLQDANQARKYWKNTIKSAGNFVNPLENTVDYLQAGAKLDNLGSFAKVAGGFGAFYSDVRGMRLAYGESTLEGGMVRNQMERDLLEEFQQKHGRVPNKQEAIDIRNTAEQAGRSTAFWNMPVIFFSNKIVLDGLVRGKFKNFQADIVDTGVSGKALFNPGKNLKNAYTKLSDGFFTRQWQKIKTPKLALTGLGKYMKANLAEGFQEIGQETIAGWQEDYYTAQFNGDNTRGGYYAYLGDNLLKQVSPQGFETFMSGFLMGGPMSVMSTAAGKLGNKQTWSDLSMRLNDPERWDQVQKQRDAKLTETVELLNQFYEDPKKYLSEDLINMVEQGEYNKLMTLAEQEGNMQDYYDFKDSSGFKHVATALKFGRFDAHLDNLSAMKNLTAEEIKESHNMSQEQWNKVIDVSIERAEQIKARYELAQTKYANPFDPNRYREKNPDGSINSKYAEEQVNKDSWDAAIEEMIFNQYSFDRSLERQESILSKAKDVSGFKNTPYNEFNVMFDLKSASGELDILKKEIDAFEGSEIINAEQKKYYEQKKQQYDLLKAFTDAVQEGITNLTEANKFTEEDYDSIKTSFDAYTSYLANKHGEYVNVDNLDSTFKELMDYHLLKDRSFAANDAVNNLLNPKQFLQRVDRIKELKRQIHENRKAEIKKSLEEYIKMMDTNDMLNELYDAGMFFKVEDIEALQKEGKVPDTFYYVNETSEGALEVPADSEDYEKALEILRRYIPVLTNIDIGKVNMDPYTQMGRAKLKNDKRTYEDYAKQYGFDPDAPETEVPLMQVLQTIEKSKHATAREKELARKLLEIVDKNEKVKFVNNSTKPGSYSESTQTVIDARWSSNDYQQGVQGAALEQVILKQEMTRRAVEAVQKDSGFKKEMKTLMNEAFDAYENLTDKERSELIDDDKREFEGFYTIEGFVAEAMMNEKFQAFLGTITTKQEAKIQDGWKTFVQKVLRQIRKILGGTPNGTVLNAAMSSITAKLDSMYSSISPKAAKQKPIEEAGEQFANVTNKTPIAELRSKHGSLANAILNEYIAENERREQDGRDPLDEDYANKSPEEIFDSVEFSAYVKSSQWRNKEALIKEYNKSGSTPEGGAPATTFSKEDVTDAEYDDFKQNNKVRRLRIITIAEKRKNKEPLSEREREIFETTDPDNPEKDWGGQIKQYIQDSVAEVPPIKETSTKRKLRELGYTSKEIKLMSAGEAWRLAYQGLTKSERNELELADQQAAREELAQQRRELREQTENTIKEASSPGELMEIRISLLTELSANNLLRTAAGYTANEIEDLIQARLEELALNVKFDDIEVGEYVVLNDAEKTLAKVISKDNTQRFIVISAADNPLDEQYINEDDMLDKILYRDSPASRALEEEEDVELTPEDEGTANETVNSSEDISANAEEIDSSWNAGESDSWLDDVNTCDT